MLTHNTYLPTYYVFVQAIRSFARSQIGFIMMMKEDFLFFCVEIDLGIH